MPNKLENLKITSTDLVRQGANPDARVRMFKRRDAPSDDEGASFAQKLGSALSNVLVKMGIKPVAKDAETFAENLYERNMQEVSNEAWDFCYALYDSLHSIIGDGSLSADEKSSMMQKSLDEFMKTAQSAAPKWANGQRAETAEAGESATINKTEEDTIAMPIEKSKMTPEDRAALEALEKKYGQTIAVSADPAPTTEEDDVAKEAALATPPELHPEVQKAIDDNKTLAAQVEELKKSLEINGLATVAKKYEVIGKKADELAPKLYDLKKAGGTAYDDFVALLDEQVALVEKSGLFTEIGKNSSGGVGGDNAWDAIEKKADEIQKSDSSLSRAVAVAKACEQHPDLVNEYEKNRQGG